MAVSIEDSFAVVELVTIGCDCNSQRVLDFRGRYATEDEAVSAAAAHAVRNKQGFYAVLPLKWVRHEE